MKAWLKGGLIGLIITFLISLIFAFPNSFEYFPRFIQIPIGVLAFIFSTIPFLIWDILDDSFFGGVLDISNFPINLLKEESVWNAVPTISGFILLYLIWFIIGAILGLIIGWIVGKIRSKKQTKQQTQTIQTPQQQTIK